VAIMVAPTDLIEAEKTTETSPAKRQLKLPFEFPPANECQPIDDPLALCRWEDDRGNQWIRYVGETTSLTGVAK
jgi:hypothetical protein